MLYEVAQGRQIRYTFSRLDDPARLIVETTFIDRGNADKVTRLYEPAKAAAPSAPGEQTSSSGSPPPPAGTPPPTSSIPGPGAEFRGLSEIGVVVEELTSQSTGCALNQSALETAVFKHLTDAGLKPRRNSDEDTYVYVNISTATVSNGLCVSRYDVYLTTHTMAKLSYQDRPVLVEVTLMHKGSMAGGQAQAHADNVMKGVLDDVDEIAAGFARRTGRRLQTARYRLAAASWQRYLPPRTPNAQLKRRLQHGPGVRDVVDLADKTAAARVRVPDRPGFAIDVDGPRMLRVNRARVFLTHQLPHHGKQVHLSRIQEHLGVVHIRRPHDDVAEMHVVDAVALAEVAADRHGILAQLARDTAVERHAVVGAVHQAQVLFPVFEGRHQLFRSAADRHGRVVWV